MTYEVFKARVNALVERAGGNLSPRFSKDTDKGRYFANFEDGTVIIGHATGLKMTVRFGSGHCAMAAI